MNEQEGRWVTMKGTHVFVEDGQSPMDAFLKQRGESKSENLTYDSNTQGKLTRNKFISYLDDVGKKMEYMVDHDDYYKDFSEREKEHVKKLTPNNESDYNGITRTMRMYGYGMKDITNLEFKSDKKYEILATFNDGNKIIIYDMEKYGG